MKTYLLFAIYDLNDNPVKTCDNYKELVSFFDKPLKSMQSSICNISKGKIKSILNNKNGLRYKVYKYKLLESELND